MEHPVAAAEARQEELRHQVVVVEDQPRSPPAGRPCGEQQEVRRIARVHRVERTLCDEALDDSPGAPESGRVLAHIARQAAPSEAQRVAVDGHAVAHFQEGALVRACTRLRITLRADHDDLAPGPRERQADVPHPAIRRDRLVLAENQDTRGTLMAGHGRTLVAQTHAHLHLLDRG